MAALLHLFFMAAFAWMLVEGLLLWSKVVAVNLSEDRHMKYYYLIGWGISFALFILSFCLTKSADVNLDVDNNSYSLPIFFCPFVAFLTPFPLSRTASFDCYHYAVIILRKIHSGGLLLAQRSEWCHLGLHRACHIHHYGW